MTPTRRSFFAALAALVVAPKGATPAPSASAMVYLGERFDCSPCLLYATEPRALVRFCTLCDGPCESHGHSRSWRYDDHETHLRTHLEDLQATPPRGSTHLERANRIAWRRHLREHELAIQGLMSMRDGRSAFWA